MKTGPLIAASLAALSLGACQERLPDMPAPERVSTRNEAPPWAEPGTCWGKDETPAVIETVTEQMAVRPAAKTGDGAVATPAAYETKTRQKIVAPRRDTWFETPCEEQLTPEFTASLQRALKVRGHYRGPVTGQMDGRTRTAIRAYQKPQGLDSAMISLATARQLGLVTVDTGTTTDGARVPLRQPATEPRVALAAPAPAAEAADAAALAQPPRTGAGPGPTETDAEPPAAEAPDQTTAAAPQARDVAERAAKKTEQARRAAELEAALKAEKARKARDARPLPVSTETY